MLNENIKLSENFYLKEFLVSAEHPEIIKNILIPEEYVKNIQELVTTILQPVRNLLDNSIRILSGYRPKELNDLIHGSKTSDHMIAAAADITNIVIIKYLKDTAYNIWELDLPIKQLIYYPDDGFIHLSINTKGKPYKHELLREHKGTYIKEKS